MIYDKVDALKSLKPNKDFAWDGTDYSGLTYYGGDTVPTESEIDAEVTAVPEAITGTKDEVDSDNNPVYQGIDQSKLVPLLTAALQEAIAKIETLETKVAALEAG